MHERFENFTVLMMRINRSIRRLKTDEMKKWGLKSHHVSCLYYLYKSNGLNATELGELCIEDKAALSRAIDTLEEEGYLVCNSSTIKRYRSPLELTEKGKEVGKSLANRIDAVLEATSDGVSDADRKIMYSALEKISARLEALCYGDEE